MWLGRSEAHRRALYEVFRRLKSRGRKDQRSGGANQQEERSRLVMVITDEKVFFAFFEIF
jgi:hypothetical protein